MWRIRYLIGVRILHTARILRVNFPEPFAIAGWEDLGGRYGSGGLGVACGAASGAVPSPFHAKTVARYTATSTCNAP